MALSAAPFLRILIEAPAQGGGAGRLGLQALSKPLEVGEMELEQEVRRSPSGAATGSSPGISVDLGPGVFRRAR